MLIVAFASFIFITNLSIFYIFTFFLCRVSNVHLPITKTAALLVVSYYIAARRSWAIKPCDHCIIGYYFAMNYRNIRIIEILVMLQVRPC